MEYELIVDFFAQRVAEERRAEFKERAAMVEDVAGARALEKEFGFVATRKDKDEILSRLEDVELSDDMLRNVSGGGSYKGDVWMQFLFDL